MGLVFTVSGTRSREEIIDEIRSLRPADWARLKLISNRYSRAIIPAEDLLQEAFARALDERKCPRQVDIVRFLAEVMRSIAHDEYRKLANHPFLVHTNANTTRDTTCDLRDPTAPVEDRVIQAEYKRHARKRLLAIFEDDLVAQEVLKRLMDEQTAREIRESIGLSQTAYNSKRKKIRRRIKKLHPEGFTP